MQNNEINTFRRRGDLGVPFVVGIFILAIVLGFIVFRNFSYSAKNVTIAMTKMNEESVSLSIENCAERTMNWYKSCDSISQICDDTVSRMIKVCLKNGDKSSQCSVYGNEVNSYNFGIKQCSPYLHGTQKKLYKKACGDIWQAVADYCKSVNKNVP